MGCAGWFRVLQLKGARYQDWLLKRSMEIRPPPEQTGLRGPTLNVMNRSHTNWNDGSSGFSARDRRLGIRFPIEMELNYRVGTKSAEWIAGRTINISSSGILVRTDYLPVRGSKVQLALAWPPLLDKRVPLRLVVEGHVVRAGAGQVAVTFQRFEFRTAGRVVG